jgi:hypothetical protein
MSQVGVRMTLDELLSTIYAGNCDTVMIARRELKTGNADGKGNYRILKMSCDKQTIEFKDKSGSWEATPVG